MTLLVDWQIKRMVENGQLGIHPFNVERLNPSSYDVTLGDTFTKIVPNILYTKEPGVIDPTNPKSFTNQTFKAVSYNIQPGEFILAEIQEHISFPDNISGKVMGKSSLGRLGLENSSCAGHADPGFGWSARSMLTIELYNYNHYPIKLTAGMKIGQVVFSMHERASVPYDKKSTSKYNGQSGAQGSRGV